MPTEKKYEEKTLLLLLAEDNEYAFQLLFDRHRNRIYRMAMMYVKSQALAEDIVQDVFLKLWFQRKTLKDVSCLESWIYTITKNYTLNCLKKLAHEWTMTEALSHNKLQFDNSTDHKIRTAQYEALLQKAIEQLPQQQQKVYILAKEKGLSYEAIANQLSLSRPTVKTHMSRALDSMRTFLRRHGADFIILLIIEASIF